MMKAYFFPRMLSLTILPVLFIIGIFAIVIISSLSSSGTSGVSIGLRIIIPFLAIFFVILFQFRMAKKIKRNMETMKQKAQEMAAAENQRLQGRQIRWIVPPQFPSWLELSLDYKLENQMNAQMIMGNNPMMNMPMSMNPNVMNPTMMIPNDAYNHVIPTQDAVLNNNPGMYSAPNTNNNMNNAQVTYLLGR